MKTTLNPELIARQGLTDLEVGELEILHHEREQLFARMESLDPTKEYDRVILRQSVDELEQLEFSMQRAWRFDETRSMHSWWYRAPHCKCPKLDNADPIMSAQGRIIAGDCPLHG